MSPHAVRIPRTPPTSAKQWLDDADRFLPPEEVASIRAKMKEGALNRLKQLERETQRAREEFTAISGGPALLPMVAPVGVEVVDEPPSERTSVAKLVLRYAKEKPGSAAAEFIAYVKVFRRVKDRDVHNVLYKLSRPEGPQTLRREGEKPHTKFYLASSEAKPAKRR